MRKFYFVRQPDHMIECSDNLPNQVNLHLIKQHHKIFHTLEEALQYQKILGVEPERVRIERNKEFRQLGLDEIYGYKNSTEGGINMQKKKDHEQINDGLLGQMQDVIEDLAKENKQASEFVRLALSYAQFAGLVKQMRECQRKIARFVSAVDPITYDEYEASQDVLKLEHEVDEYLKKMEV